MTLFSLVTLVVSALEAPAIAQTPISACGTLSAAGHYVLTSNLSATGTCLILMADDIVIDLNGFTIAGDGLGGGQGIHGVSLLGVTILHGTIRGFGGRGIELDGSSARVEGVEVRDNAGGGIRVNGLSIVNSNRVHKNGGTGIETQGVSIVTGNIVHDNAGDGILVFGPRSLVTGNSSSGNGDRGIIAFGGASHTLSNNTASGNKVGIKVNCPSNLIGNTARDNSTANLQTTGKGCVKSHNLF